MPEPGSLDFVVSVDGSPLGDSVKTAVIQITVDERIDQASVCTIELMDAEGKLSDGSNFKVGAELKVQLGTVEDKKTVFEGEVTGHKGAFPRRGTQRLTVIALDCFHRMRRARKRRTFLQVKDSDIASQIAGDYGFSPETKVTPVKHDYVLQINQSDADFLLERAALFGYEVFVDDGKKLVFRAPQLDVAPVVKLEWHKNLIHFAPTISVARTHAEVKSTGYDMKQKKAVTASKKKGDESSLMGGTKPGSELRATVSSTETQMPFMPMLSPDEADAIATGVLDRNALRFVTGEGSALGSALIRRGKLIEIDEVGSFLSGKYYVTAAIHTLLKGGYTTTFRVQRTAVQKPPESLPKPKEETPKKPTEKEPEPKDVVFIISDDTGKKAQGIPYILRKPDGSTKTGKLGSDGKVEEKKVPPGVYVLELESVSVANVPEKLVAGEKTKIAADVTGLAPGSTVTFEVYEPFGLGGDPVETLTGTTSDESPHRVEVDWTYDPKKHKDNAHGSELVVVTKAGETAVSITRPFLVVEKLERTIQDANGKPLPKQKVILRSQRGPNYEATTDGNGILETYVPPGDYRIEIPAYEPRLTPKPIVHVPPPLPAGYSPFDPKPGPPPKAPKLGIFKLDLLSAATGKAVERFAPGDVLVKGATTKTKDEVKVVYQIDDPTGAATEVKFELFRTVKAKLESVPVWTKVLTSKEGKSGTHEWIWNGEISGHTAGDAFPDSFVSAAYSPYLLRLSIAGPKDAKADPTSKEKQIKVEFDKIELALGEETLLTGTDDLTKRSKKVRKQVADDGGLPAKDATDPRLVYLESDIYSSDPGYAQLHDETFHDKYKTMWGDGPLIPLTVDLWFKDSQDRSVLAPMGMGDGCVLWDFEDPAKTLSNITAAAAKTYVKDKIEKDKDTALPKGGTNLHADYGGKRSATGAPAVFDLTTLPTELKSKTVPTKRKWALFTRAGKTDPLFGKSAAMFRPSRFPGDTYKLTVYADVKGEGDTDGAVPITKDELKKATGTFEVWRLTNFTKFYTNRATASGTIDIAGTVAHLKPAGIKVTDSSGGATDFPSVAYNSKVNTEVANVKAAGGVDSLIDKAVDTTANHMAVTLTTHPNYRAAVAFRKYDDFFRKVQQAWFTAAAIPLGGVIDDFRGGGTAVQIQGLVTNLNRGAWTDAVALVRNAGNLNSGGDTLAVSKGDLVRFDGTKWVLQLANAGGFPPANTRARLGTDIHEWDGTQLGAVVRPEQDVANDDATKNYLTTGGLGTKTDYWKKVNQDWVNRIVKPVCNSYIEGQGTDPPKGGWLFQFDYLSPLNWEDSSVSTKFGGYGPAFANAGDGAFGIVMCSPPNAFTAPSNVEEILAHEFGHVMLLAHSPDSQTSAMTGNANKPSDPAAHDSAEPTKCMMSYSPQPLHFCGGCILRLRGWKKP